MSTVSYERFRETSCLDGTNAPYLEEIYERFLTNPASLDAKWQEFFAELEKSPEVKTLTTSGGISRQEALKIMLKQLNVLQLIEAYRVAGVRKAHIDPLGRQVEEDVKNLSLAAHGLSEEDLSMSFLPGSLPLGESVSLRSIVAALEKIYCDTIGVEYMHISQAEQRLWLQQRLENLEDRAQLLKDDQLRALGKLIAAEGLEQYLHTKYVGQKRFSLEGGDTFIPMLDYLIRQAAGHGVKELVMAMAHRGRLNVLVNILGKLPSELYGEFEGKTPPEGTLAAGDVKYHKGFSSNMATPAGAIHVALVFNPSHLEIANPVAVGSVRARLDRYGDPAKVLAVLVHGDAAFAGQGVGMETFELARTRGYGIGGTVHVVINNQIGFTTSDPRDTRSTIFCTDLAKMVEAPIFHVNADDPEAVLYVTKLALEYRMTFGEDVVIDLVCYRKRGHNEADEPKITQPLMYRAIDRHPGTKSLYGKSLVSRGVLTQGEAQVMEADYHERLARGTTVVPELIDKDKGMVNWRRFAGGSLSQVVETGVDGELLTDLGRALSETPSHFRLHPLAQRVMNNRRAMSLGEMPLDWAMAENLAYATLLSQEKLSVRISGEDCGRGTFFQRVAVFHDQDRERWDDGCFVPLTKLGREQGKFVVIDSPLSEEAVLAFEYGYAATDPDTLVVWEAQFGDFANGAQVVIDQFISAGEVKWGRLCGLTMFLPHGYEGQGPEHSSARPERYLQLCADNNIQVVVPSTPAQLFHLLRRQMLRGTRKPLVVMTPKSMLRNPASVSSLEDLATGRFQPVIGDKNHSEASRLGVKRVIACCGKVYYDLAGQVQKRGLTDVAVMRVEELYPLPIQAIKDELALYPNAATLVWAQDEPRNQGYWTYLLEPLTAMLEELPESLKLRYAGRPASASPAVGYHDLHVAQQEALLESALIGG